MAETNPLDGTTFLDGYKRIIAINMGCLIPGKMHGRVEFGVWSSRQAFLDDRPMIRSFGVPISEEPVYKSNDQGMYVGAEGDELVDQDDVSLRTTVAPSMTGLLTAVIPGFELTMNDAVKSVAYAALSNHEEISDGVEV